MIIEMFCNNTLQVIILIRFKYKLFYETSLEHVTKQDFLELYN